jgi:GNAT superfamily N-acetyltransferase
MADPPVAHNADVIALAISGLIDIAWQGVLFDSKGFDCQQIRMQCLAFLATVFPWVFVPDTGSRLNSRDFGRKDLSVTVRMAVAQDQPALARLVNLYRQSQGAASDLPGSSTWVGTQLASPTMSVLVAEEPGGKLHGFAHTIASSCPFTLSPYRVLRALFVDGDLRRGGVGQALLRKTRELCREQGESHLEIDTPADNAVAKALYQTSGARADQQTVRLVLTPLSPA